MVSSKKRVVFIGSFLKQGETGNVGGQMYACGELVKSSLSSDVHWLLIDTTSTSNLQTSFISRLIRAIFRIIKFFYYIIFFEVDAVLAFSSSGYSILEKGYMLRISKFFGKRTILAPRSGYLLDEVRSNKKFKKKVVKILDACNIVICQSEFWKFFFTEEMYQSSQKLVVIYNWIDLNKYGQKAKNDSEKKRVLFMGWINKNKGIWDLLEAVKVLKNTNFVLYVAGNGEDFLEVESEIYKCSLQDRVVLLNWVYGSEKVDLLNSCDIFVQPSYREGLPNALLEAMASHCAIIASRVGSIPDIITDNVNGRLITPGDYMSIANALFDYLECPSLLSQHSKAARQFVVENNSLELAVNEFKKIL